jgi:hypothetical protein
LACILDLQHRRADDDDTLREQPDGAELDLASLAQDLALDGQRRHRHGPHQVDGHARDPHRNLRRNLLRGPDHQRRRRRAVLHARVPWARRMGTGDDVLAVNAKDGFH